MEDTLRSLWTDSSQGKAPRNVLVQFTSLDVPPLLSTPSPHQVTCPERSKCVYSNTQSCSLWLLLVVSHWMSAAAPTFQGHATPRTEEPLTMGQVMAGRRTQAAKAGFQRYVLSTACPARGATRVCTGGGHRRAIGAASAGHVHAQLRFRRFQFLQIFLIN